MIQVTTKGNFDHLEKFLAAMKRKDHMKVLDEYGRIGVEALRAATPVRTGATADAWAYEVETGNGEDRIVWTNSNEHNGFRVAIALQYGHGTGTGGYVFGRDYINPALRDVFDRLAEEVWKGVTSA